MDALCPFARPVHDFLTYLRVEAGLAPATLEAYGRDLADLVDELRTRRIRSAADVAPSNLADHVRALHRERGLQAS